MPLAHDDQYFLDAAMEHGEITGATHTAIMLYGDPAEVSAITDKRREGRGWRGARGDICVEISWLAVRIVKTLPLDIAGAIAAAGYASLPRLISDVAEFLSCANFDDCTIGGHLQPYRKYERWNHNTYEPTKGALRHLTAPKAIRRYVKMDDQTVPHLAEICRALRAMPIPGRADFDRLNEIMDAAADASRREAVRRTAEINFQRTHAPPYRIIRKPQRRALARAAAIAAAVMGQAAVSAFVAGQPVRVDGASMSFELSLGGSITTEGHGAMKVGVLSPEGARLASLCVYVKDTPALDQLAAFALHAAAGEERAIFDRGNLYAITGDGMDHPLIVEKRAKAPEAAPGFAALLGPHDRRRAAQNAYYDATGYLYRAALFEVVMGRGGRLLARVA